MQLNKTKSFQIQNACYAMTGEERRKSSERISVPPEIIRDVIQKMMKEYEEAVLPERMERIKIMYP